MNTKNNTSTIKSYAANDLSLETISDLFFIQIKKLSLQKWSP